MFDSEQARKTTQGLLAKKHLEEERKKSLKLSRKRHEKQRAVALAKLHRRFLAFKRQLLRHFLSGRNIFVTNLLTPRIVARLRAHGLNYQVDFVSDVDYQTFSSIEADLCEWLSGRLTILDHLFMTHVIPSIPDLSDCFDVSNKALASNVTFRTSFMAEVKEMRQFLSFLPIEYFVGQDEYGYLPPEDVASAVGGYRFLTRELRQIIERIEIPISLSAYEQYQGAQDEKIPDLAPLRILGKNKRIAFVQIPSWAADEIGTSHINLEDADPDAHSWSEFWWTRLEFSMLATGNFYTLEHEIKQSASAGLSECALTCFFRDPDSETFSIPDLDVDFAPLFVVRDLLHALGYTTKVSLLDGSHFRLSINWA